MPVHPQIPTRSETASSESTSCFLSAGLIPQQGPVAVEETIFVDARDPDPLARIGQVLDNPSARGKAWAIMLGYELGGHIEPSACAVEVDHEPMPLVVIQRLGEALTLESSPVPDFELGALTSSMGRAEYTRAVECVRQYIAAGDIYQANIAHHLSATFSGSPFACAQAMLNAAQPRFGAVMRFMHGGKQHVVCSVSPELFVRLDARTGVISTEPMKGTRPIDADAGELHESPKDRAELNMITDLMRNDLGRVCTLGSVRVTDVRKVESHRSGVLQASSVIEGRLRPGVRIEQLIRATFPPGSVTGAPKVRAMQIINEIERRPRGVYCGSLMHLDAQGNLHASVSIRTAHIWGDPDPDHPERVVNARFNYPVGAGIVADSDPQSEWEETLTKARILGSIVRAPLEIDGVKV